MKGKFTQSIVLLFSVIFTQSQAQDIRLDDFHNGTLRTNPGKIYPFTPDGNDLLQMSRYADSQNIHQSTHWYISLVKPENNFKTGDTLFHSKWFSDSVPLGRFTFSQNREFLLIETNQEAIYRHSYSVNAYVVNIKNRTLKEIPGRLRYPTLSPENDKVAFVRDNNLFVYDLNQDKGSQITNDGEFNSIINGAVDWVYEEEFSMSKGFEWSPSGRYIAYYKFDERKVREFSMDEFRDLYPNQVEWKYPKAGEDNSKVDVFVYDLQSTSNLQLPLLSQNDQYIPRFQWLQTDENLSVQRLNRLQNHWELLIWNTKDNQLTEVIQEGSETYIDINDQLTVIPGSSTFLYLSDISGYRHIYAYDYKKNQVSQITSGFWQVNKILAYRPKTKNIFYTSTETSTLEDHVFQIKIDGKNKKSVLNQPALSGNEYAICSREAQWMYIINSSMAGTPHYKTYLLGDKFKYVHTDTNFSKKVTAMNLSEVVFDEIQVPNTEFSLNYYIIKPKNFDPNKKYPLLMHCYGGPGNSICRNSINSYYSWYQFLANQGYIIACVDNRGTGNKGEAFQKCTYKNLGKIEQEDQRMSALYFRSLPYIDSNRIGIWGWSFGGYLTSLCMVKSPDVFKMGMAVAPVTHWKYYDNIYTERYLQRPIDNPKGYEDNSPINFTKNLEGRYLIVHGTGDDNVHFQNTAEMINSLIKSGKNFDSEIYPNRAHGISDKAARVHLFTKLTNYILENL